MFHVGEPPVEIAERGTQSVELRSEGMAAFVRVPDRPLNQRTVLAVLATEPDHRIRLIFSTKGFTPAAISIAEAQGIALFSFDAEGSALPDNGQEPRSLHPRRRRLRSPSEHRRRSQDHEGKLGTHRVSGGRVDRLPGVWHEPAYDTRSLPDLRGAARQGGYI